MTRRRKGLYLGMIVALLLLTTGWYWAAFIGRQHHAPQDFDSARAYADVKTQVAFGPRIPGSAAHDREVNWIRQQLELAGWHVEIQRAEAMGHPIQNIRADRGEATPEVLLGAHYDSRIYASQDPDPHLRTQPVPGANDGASGVAVLLELARTLPRDAAPVWLIFFDAEDNGDIPGWDWILGSKVFVQSMKTRPKALILVDMVGDEQLSLPMEANSDLALRTSIWQTASQLGYGNVFVPHTRYTVEDDHLPFIQAGIPSVDIIDLDYPYWHTVSDTPEHVSPKSLQIVGDVLASWLGAQGTQ